MKILRRFYQKDDIFKLTRRKGVYPYECIDSWEKFDETELLSKESFYSKFNMKGMFLKISEMFIWRITN